MEKIEEKIKRSIRKATIKNTVLGLVATAGVLSSVAIAPGVFKILKLLNIRPQDLFNKKQAIYNAVSRLKKDNLLEEKMQNGKKYFILTEKGKKYFEILQNTNKKQKKKWDKKWRIVIFDIEEKYRNIRDKVRKELTQYGFVKLQHSVWIYPYPCEDYISLLKTDNRTGKHLIYMVADEIEQSSDLKKIFNLS